MAAAVVVVHPNLVRQLEQIKVETAEGEGHP
jgi:hypothetical protein